MGINEIIVAVVIINQQKITPKSVEIQKMKNEEYNRIKKSKL